MKKNYKSKPLPITEGSSGWQNRFNALLRSSGRRPRRWYRRWWGIIILIIAALFSLFVAVYLYKVVILVWQLKPAE